MTKATDQATLPQFYSKPVLLRFEEHKTAGVTRPDGFAFAGGAIAVPIGIGEFAAVQRHYPIVFSAGDNHSPLAVLGMREGQNLFVEADGSWKKNSYVPAYVRRYPFIVIDADAGEKQLLAIDAGSERFAADAAATEGAMRLYDDAGEPTDAAREAMTFCHAFHQEYLASKAFVEALDAAGLLTENHARLDLPTGSTVLNGFMSIDEAAYRRLHPETLAEWHAKGWLDLVALHLASAASWANLLELQIASEGEQREAA